MKTAAAILLGFGALGVTTYFVAKVLAKPEKLIVQIFGPYPAFPVVGDAVGFEAPVSNGTMPYDYEWQFGIGGPTSIYHNPVWYPTAAGTYLVTLKVTDSEGEIGSASLNITVLP